MTITGHGNEPNFLPDSAFCSQAIGRNDIARSLVGRAHWLYELETGTNPFPSELPSSTKNPQKKLGHDHSGPPFGSCFLHPIAWWSNQKANATKLVQPTTPLLEAVIFDGQTPLTMGPLVFWNRPHTSLPQAFGTAPYSRLVLYVVAHKKAANADLTVRIAKIDANGEETAATVDTISITSATPTGYVLDAAGDIANGHVAVAHYPANGGRNIMHLEFSSTAAAADALTVDAWALCNVRKRRWLNP